MASCCPPGAIGAAFCGWIIVGMWKPEKFVKDDGTCVQLAEWMLIKHILFLPAKQDVHFPFGYFDYSTNGTTTSETSRVYDLF